MRKFLSIILISLLYFSSANAQIFLETQITYPETGVLGSVHYSYNDTVHNYKFVTEIMLMPAISVDTIITGADITEIDSVVKNYYVFVVDTQTFDTLSRAFFIIGDHLDGYQFHHYYANVVFNSISSVSASYLCDGICIADVNIDITDTTNGDTVNYTLRYNINHNTNTYSSLQINDFNFSSLCEGEYQLVINNGSNIVYYTTFYINPEVVSQPNYIVNALTYSSSTQTSCNGRAKAIINGGVSPYYYSWDNDVYSSNDSISDLCVGLHTLIVVDANSDTVAINFGITDTSSTFNNQNNTGVTPNDTLLYLIENCDIDYSQTVDSAFVSDFTVIDSTTFILECEIWQSGNVTQTLDTLVFNTQGVNYLEIVFYCNTNKSTTSLLKITDYINIENITNVLEITDNNIKLYPNPSNGNFIIEGENINNITVVDINGRVIKSININSTKINIELLDKQKGIYFAKILSDNKVIVKKLIVK